MELNRDSIYCNKFPSNIVAIQYDGNNKEEIREFINDDNYDLTQISDDKFNTLIITNLTDGDMRAIYPDNYICQDLSSDPSIFILSKEMFNTIMEKYCF